VENRDAHRVGEGTGSTTTAMSLQRAR
jgi:hypothetical protein